MRHHSRGFTLVELLVVIGIIAILLPSLAGTRRQANLLKCAATQKQFVGACLFRAAERKGFSRWPGRSSTTRRTATLGPR